MDMINERPQRKRIRLSDHDYSCGAYFVTICTINHCEILGKIENGSMKLSDIGEIVESEWIKLDHYSKGIQLDLHVVMPNHIHGIVILEKGFCITLQT